MASTDPRILNDQALVDYSYRSDPSIGPPTLSNGVELTRLRSFSENGADVPGSINIDILQDSSGKLYVVSRGTDNLQNGLTDLQLANDPVSQVPVHDAGVYLQKYAGVDIEFGITVTVH